MRTITVELGERSYPIYVGRGILTDLPGKFSSHKLSSRIAIVSDRNVASRHLKRLSGILRRSGIPFIPLLMPAGERQKSLSRFNTMTTQLLGAGHRRGSAIAAPRGGPPARFRYRGLRRRGGRRRGRICCSKLPARHAVRADPHPAPRPDR